MTRHVVGVQVAAKNKNKSLRAILIAVMLSCVALCGLAGCQTNTEIDTELTPTVETSATKTAGTLTVGINASNTPYGGTNSSNETIGLDVDIAAALAQELGLKLQIVDVSSNGRNALTNGQVDLVMGLAKSGTADKITYTDAYINDGVALYTLEGSASVQMSEVTAQVEAGEAKIIVQANTTAAYTVQDALGIDALVTESTMQDAFTALESGTAPYLVTNAVIGDYFARSYDGVVRVGFLSADSVTPMYAATLTGNVELTTAAQKALATITGNGTLRVINAKWLGESGSSLMPDQVDITQLPSRAFES